jgi:hypothetical protein
MEHPVQAPRYIDEVGDVLLDESEMLVAAEVSDVVGAPRDEVVHPDDVVAVGEEAVREMRSEEAGDARDQDSHRQRPIEW